MVHVDEAARLASNLPGVTADDRHGNRAWFVGTKALAWVRPFRKADLRRFGKAPVPTGPILAVRVADLRAKEAVLATATRGVFTIPHFDGYAAVLIQLDAVPVRALKNLLTDAWLAVAPPAAAEPSRARTRKTRR